MKENEGIIQVNEEDRKGKEGRKMLTEERLQEIWRIVTEKGSVSIQQLMDELNISESTARRDLTILDEQGRLQKVRGGAMVLGDAYSTKEDSVVQKKDKNLAEKREIARYAASLIEEDDFVYLDAGTTTELMIEYLKTKNTVFVTNAVTHARKLSQAGYTTFILGGEMKSTTEAIVGDEAVQSLSKYNFTKGFWGVNGIHPKNGFSTPDVKEANVKRTAMEHCARRYILGDASKFSQISCVKFGDFANACIITSKIKDPIYQQCENIIQVQGGEDA